MLTEEQAKKIKNQIISQISVSFPEEKKEFAIKRIESMNSGELEEFLVKNNLASEQANQKNPQQCVFCSIVSGGIDSHKVGENENAIAVLEINPVSKGHVLVIPKEHALNQGNEKNVKELIKNVSNIIKKKLKPKKIIVVNSNLFGHETISVIPQFNNETADSQRHSATPEELLELKNLLAEKKKNVPVEKQPKKIKITSEEKIWLPRRIP